MTVVSSGYERKANELYNTEPWATKLLLKHFPVQGKRVWEPAAGQHLMADVLREGGADVFTSDIETYTRTHDTMFDFLGDKEPHWPAACDAIITNPPYGFQNRMAVKFIERALERCSGHVAMLLAVKIDSGVTRRHIFMNNPRFIARLTLLDRISWEGNGKSGTEDHAWFVWGPMPVFHSPPRMLYGGKADV